MTIVLIICAGVAIVLVLLFFAVNKWSGRSQDKESTAKLRRAAQMNDPTIDSRGDGIN